MLNNNNDTEEKAEIEFLKTTFTQFKNYYFSFSVSKLTYNLIGNINCEDFNLELSYEQWSNERSKINFKNIEKEIKEIQDIILRMYDKHYILLFPLVIMKIARMITLNKKSFKIFKYLMVF